MTRRALAFLNFFRKKLPERPVDSSSPLPLPDNSSIQENSIERMTLQERPDSFGIILPVFPVPNNSSIHEKSPQSPQSPRLTRSGSRSSSQASSRNGSDSSSGFSDFVLTRLPIIGLSLSHVVAAVARVKMALSAMYIRETVKHDAEAIGDGAMIKALKDTGTDASVKDHVGMTPMHCAAFKGHVGAIKALKDAGADASVKDHVGITPMHCAAVKGYVEAIKALKDAGAGASVRTSFRKTPMDFATANGHVEAIKALEDAELDKSMPYEVGGRSICIARALDFLTQPMRRRRGDGAGHPVQRKRVD